MIKYFIKLDDDLSHIDTSYSKSSADQSHIETYRKIIIQCVIYYKNWYLVQVFIEDGNKSILTDKDAIGIRINPIQRLKSTYSRKFSVTAKTFIENLQTYMFSPYHAFYFVKQLPHSAIVEFIRNLSKIVLFKKDEVTLSTDYIKQEIDEYIFSFRENRVPYVHEVFEDSIRSSKKKKKKIAKTEADFLFEKNYNEVYDKYFSNKKNLVLSENIDNVVDREFGNIKVDSDEEIHVFHQNLTPDTENSFSRERKSKRLPESSHWSDDHFDRFSQLKSKYYFRINVPNYSVLYLRIEPKRSTSALRLFDTYFIVLSGYHPLKGQIYYKEVYSQKTIVHLHLF